MDIASLSVEVNTGSAAKGASDLDKLSASAAKAERQAQRLAAATAKTNGAVSLAAERANRAARSEASLAATRARTAAQDVRTQHERIRLVEAELRLQERLKRLQAMNDNNQFGGLRNTRFGNNSVGNVAAQFQDIGVTAAMGMSPMMIALQQGTQLAPIIAQLQNPLRDLAVAFGSIISPLSLFVIGLVALIAAGLQFVDWTKLAANTLRALANILPVIAPYAVAAAAGLALLYSPAMIAGIVQLIALMGRLVVQVGILAIAFIASNPFTAFLFGMIAVVAAMNIFREELKQVFGRDIVGDLKDAANWMINAIVHAVDIISTVWGKLPAVFSEIMTNAANGVVAIINWMVKKIQEGLAHVYRMINPLAAAADFAGIKVFDKDVSGMLGSGWITQDLSMDMLQNNNAGAFDDMWKDVVKRSGELNDRDWVGEFGQAIGKGASYASEKLRELATWMETTDEKGKKGKKKQDVFKEIMQDATQRLDSLAAERQAMFLNEQQANALTIAQDMLNKATEAGVQLSPQQVTAIRMVAEEIAKQEYELKRLKEMKDFYLGIFQGFGQELLQGIRDGKTFWQAFADAGVSALQKIIDKIIEMATYDIFMGLWNGLGGSILGGGGGGGDPWGGMRLANGGAFNAGQIIPFANGGIVGAPTLFSMSAGRTGLMGEKGPEGIFPLMRGPDGKLGIQASGASAGGGAMALNMNFAPTINIEGSGDAGADVKQALEEYERNMDQRIVKSIQRSKLMGAFR